MTNIDDTRTVYDRLEVIADNDRVGWRIGNCSVFMYFKTKKQAEKFRSDLIRFVEEYK